MAFMYPSDDNFTNRGEKAMHSALREFLPDGFICYHDRKIGTIRLMSRQTNNHLRKAQHKPERWTLRVCYRAQ